MEKLTIYAVISVARQIEGEYCFVRTEKAFKTASKADAYRNELNQKYQDAQGMPRAIRIDTPNGSAECFQQAGSFIIEVED